MHLEYSHFMSCSEAVFHSAQEAIGVIALTCEIEHGVGNMFQRFGAGNGTFPGDMADDENGRMAAFCQLHKLQRALTYLANASRGGCQVAGADRLNRIYNNGNW